MWTFPRRVDSDLMGDIWTCRCDINRDVREGFYPGEKSVGEVLCVWFPCSCSSGRRCRWERGCVRVKQHSTRCAYCICVCVCEASHCIHIQPVIMYLMYICPPMFLPLSLSLCLHLSAAPPHGCRGGVGWRVVGCSAVAALVPVARRESAPRPPPQPIMAMQEAPGPMRRPSEAVGRRSGSSWEFSRLISQWGCCVSDMKAGSWSYLQPSCSLSQPQSVGSLSWAVSGDSSSPGSSQE